jgi:hypothetical protein
MTYGSICVSNLLYILVEWIYLFVTGLNYNKECEKHLIEAVKAGYSVGGKEKEP